MSKSYKAVLLDLDGTVIDTSPGIFKGLDLLIKEKDLPKVSEEDRPKFIGPTLQDSYSKYLGLSGQELIDAIEFYRNYCNQQGYKEFEYYPGMDELIDWLDKNDYQTFIVTMKENNLSQKVMKAAGYFDKLTEVKGNLDFGAKTKAELIEEVLEKYNLSKDEVLLVGDTFVDANGAKEAGIDFFPALFGYGYSHTDKIDENTPYVLKLNKPTDLISYLDQKEGINGTC